MKKVLVKYWPIFIILALSILIIWPLFLPGYFSHHDDLQVMRIFEMRKCLVDLQIPCRWVPDMGYGNGFPLFNYYSVFPYYIGAVLSFIFGYIVSAKVLFLLPLVAGGVTMYLLAKIFFDKEIAVAVATVYLFAPYRALDSYVRGAVAESFALAITPLVFFFATKLIQDKGYKNFLGLVISLAILLTSHNIMVLFFIPLLLIWMLILLLKNKDNRRLAVLSLGLGFGLATFFITPAYLEKNLVQIETLIQFDLNFRVHFVTLKQLFLDRTWGYGASILGPVDSLSFQIGWPLWWLASVSCFWLIKSKLKDFTKIVLFALLLITFLFSILMTHNRSIFIWEKIPNLSFVQFPWRFLSLTIFSGSLLTGFTILLFGRKLQRGFVVLIVLTTVLFNWNYFRPEKFINITDAQKLSGDQWRIQQKAALMDYLPRRVVEPREPAPDKPVVIRGDAIISNFVNKSNRWEFQVRGLRESRIEMPIFDFPQWEVWLDNTKIEYDDNNLLKRVSFKVPAGEFRVKGYFKDSGIRTLSNSITVLSMIILIISYAKFRKNFS